MFILLSELLLTHTTCFAAAARRVHTYRMMHLIQLGGTSTTAHRQTDTAVDADAGTGIT